MLPVVERIISFLQADLPRRHRAQVALFATLLALCVLRTYFGGPIPSMRYGPDAFIPLDGAWRVVNGQIPHVDFHTPIGPVIYLLGALSMRLAPSGISLSFSQALAGLIFAVWSLRISTRRLASVPRAMFCIFAVLLAMAPYELGESPLVLSPSTTYNRYSYVLLTFILLETLSAPRGPVDIVREERVGGLSTGVGVALLLFLKVSFFLAAILLIGVMPFLGHRRGKPAWMGCISGFAVIFVMMLFYLDGNIGAVWYDLRMAAGAKRVSLHDAADVLFQNIMPMAFLVALAFFASLIELANEDRPRTYHLTATAVAVCAISYLVILGNHQEAGMPLGVTFAILVMHWLCTSRGKSSGDRNSLLVRGVLLGWSAFILLPPIALDLVGLGYGVWKSVTVDRSSILKFDSQPLAPLLFMGPPPSRDFGPRYVACINEGLRMLRTQPGSDAIVTLANTDPFS